MKNLRGITLSLLLLSALFLAACISKNIPSNETIENNPEPAFSEGAKSLTIRLVDNNTGEIILAPVDVRYTYLEGPCETCGGGGQSTSNGTLDFLQIEYGKYRATAAAKGYSMANFEFIHNAKSNEEIIIPLSKGGCQNNCENPDAVREWIKTGFGLDASEYSIECSECMLGRGGYIKARIIQNVSPLELFYHWGWCSSGGSDCGYSMCLTSFSEKTNEVYDGVKEKYCSEVTSLQYHDEMLCNSSEAFNNTDEARGKMLCRGV